jgi:hypothetical protein
MGIRDELDAATLPREWQARQITVGDETEIVTGPMSEVANHRELLEQFGYNPDDVEIVGTVNSWRKEKTDGTWLTSYFFKVKPRERSVDLPALYAERARIKHTPVKPRNTNRVVVALFSDPQIGKRDHRGGTESLLQRLDEKRVALNAYMKTADCSRSVLVDVGDGPESFENVQSQYFTNDLSFPQQLDVYATELLKFETLMARYGSVDVLVVPSNHAAWRNGKQALGSPQDDWGLYVHRQVAKQADAAGLPVTHHYPPDFTESMVFDINGTWLGVTHGHQSNSPNNFTQWWAKQMHGGMPFAYADVAISGHYHHYRTEQTGRSLRNGRSKWWIQCPPLDNGSSWHANKSDGDSDPGMVVFVIDDDGFNIQSLTVL